MTAAGDRAATGASDPAQAVAALRAADPVMAALIDEIGPLDIAAWRSRWSHGRFESLARGIIGQQISIRAASAIYGRLMDFIGDRDPALAITAATDGELHQVGLSGNKIDSLRDLARRLMDGRLRLDRLEELSDEEGRSQLTAVRGIGPWTADLFLIGQLGRPDLLPAADVGLRHAVQAAYQLDHVPNPKELEALGERWRPHRTLATAYLFEWSRRRGRPAAPTATSDS